MIVICTFFMFAFLNSQVWAITLSFTPPSSDVLVGDLISVDVVVSGLDNDPPPPLNLAAFEFDINFDNSILEFNSYALGVELGDIDSTPAEAWDMSVVEPEAGMIHFSELSWLWDLNSQPDSFTLTTLCFTGIQGGNSDLSFSNVILSDDSWPAESLDATLGTGSINVVAPVPAPSPVPEPGTLFLMATGILGLGGVIRKFKE